MTVDELIAEALRLDAAGTKWDNGLTKGQLFQLLRGSPTDLWAQIPQDMINLELIASYRNNAPRLARALKIACEALRDVWECDGGFPGGNAAREALDEIAEELGSGDN
jgi:hypothetical protein